LLLAFNPYEATEATTRNDFSIPFPIAAMSKACMAFYRRGTAAKVGNILRNRWRKKPAAFVET
jgi:hypothetical protein